MEQDNRSEDNLSIVVSCGMLVCSQLYHSFIIHHNPIVFQLGITFTPISHLNTQFPLYANIKRTNRRLLSSHLCSSCRSTMPLWSWSKLTRPTTCDFVYFHLDDSVAVYQISRGVDVKCQVCCNFYIREGNSFYTMDQVETQDVHQTTGEYRMKTKRTILNSHAICVGKTDGD